MLSILTESRVFALNEVFIITFVVNFFCKIFKSEKNDSTRMYSFIKKKGEVIVFCYKCRSFFEVLMRLKKI